MSIRTRLLWVAIPLMLATLLAIHLLSQGLLVQRFDAGDELQLREQASNLALQVDSSINRSLNVLRSTALSDDAYAFVQGRGVDAFSKRNLDRDTVRNQDFNFVLYFDATGHLLHERWVMPDAMDWGTGQPIPNANSLRSEILQRTRELGLLAEHPSALDSSAQLLWTEGVPTVLVSSPVSDNLGMATPLGTVVAGRLLGPRRIELLSRFILGELTILPGADRTAHWQPISGYRFMRLPNAQVGQRELLGDEEQQLDLAFSDSRGTPQLRMRIRQPRLLFLQGQHTVRLFLGIAAGLSLFAIGLTALSLECWVLRRLHRLAGEVSEIGADTPTARLTVFGSDEIGRLGANVNGMLERLTQSEQRDRSILASISDGYFEAALDGRIWQSNPALCELLGRPAEVLHGTPFQALLAEPDDADRLKRLFGGLHSKRSAVLSAPMYCRGGEIRFCEAQLSPILDRSDAITGYRGMVRDISELMAYQSELEDLAYTDALTGLGNRKALQGRLQRLFLEPTDHRRKGALLFIDLDRFKQVNDRFGHAVGDALLMFFSERLRNCLRRCDEPFRLGGDEFTVLLAEACQAQVKDFVRRLQSVLAQPYLIDGKYIDFVTASIGVALHPQDAGCAEGLLKAADRAMYQAKQERNDCCFYSDVVERGVESAVK
ncbi:diguanylate cyclase domain-containing protein [Pseudomonas knackmussii]|uniref:sensor domain-containing diguanylate cyclase n=1 Tax=Pseudomonas knackmussii TaxID=65741 RepID=UPI003F4A4A73